MLVDLKQLKPNPTRDFIVDPVDEDAVKRLRASIKEHGFWGGTVCRRVNGHIQVAAGWHRIVAARQAGIEKADLTVTDVADMDDVALIRVYSTENATQRGPSSTAQTGSVAAAIRYLAKAILSESELPAGVEISAPEFAKQGLGWRPVAQFLHDVPGINKGSAQQQLAILKSSGDYKRIIGEVEKEIEAEAAEAEREAKRAEKAKKAEAEKKAAEKKKSAERAKAAKKKADEQERTFDFAGVAKEFGNAHQVDVFREVVTSKGFAPFLPVEKQADLAKELVRAASDPENKRRMDKHSISGEFIRRTAGAMIAEIQKQEHALKRADLEKLRQADWNTAVRDFQKNFARGIRSAHNNLGHLVKKCKEPPDGVSLYMRQDFRDAAALMRDMVKIVDKMGA